MLGIIGIMSIAPLVVFAICLAVSAAVSGGTALYINHKNEEAAEDNFKKSSAMQAAQQKKTEQRTKIQARIQNAVNAKQLNKTVLEAASSVTYQKILASRTGREVTKLKNENLISNSVAVTSMPEKEISGSKTGSVSGVSEAYNMGSPQKSAV